MQNMHTHTHTHTHTSFVYCTVYSLCDTLHSFIMSPPPPPPPKQATALPCLSISSSEFYIDPNMGSIKDAFSVTCKFEENRFGDAKSWTCINATKYEFSTSDDCPGTATNLKECIRVSVNWLQCVERDGGNCLSCTMQCMCYMRLLPPFSTGPE